MTNYTKLPSRNCNRFDNVTDAIVLGLIDAVEAAKLDMAIAFARS